MGDSAADFDGCGIVQMGSRFMGLLWYFRKSGEVWNTNLFVGFENPPMYGDYEAQRHWMEIQQICRYHNGTSTIWSGGDLITLS